MCSNINTSLISVCWYPQMCDVLGVKKWQQNVSPYLASTRPLTSIHTEKYFITISHVYLDQADLR